MRSLAEPNAVQRNQSRFHPSPAWVVAACAALLFLYCWLGVEPCLRYHHSAPAFRCAPAFFYRFVGQPGGLVEYAAAFLAQLDYEAWLGALVWTVLIGLILLSAACLLRRTVGAASSLVLLCMMFMLLWLYGSYDLPAAVLATRLLAALGFGLIYTVLPWNSPWGRLAACLFLMAALLHVGGLATALLFLAVCALFEMAARRQVWLGLGCILGGLMVPLGGLHLLGAPRLVLSERPYRGWGLAAVAALYVCYPLAAGLTAWRGRRAASIQGRHRPTTAGGSMSCAIQGRQTAGRKWLLPSAAAVLGWVAVWLTFDAEHKRCIQVAFYTDQRQWDQALAIAPRLRRPNAEAAINVVRALWHTGRLPESLFSIPVAANSELLPGLKGGLESCRAQAKTLLELGQVNLAEHFAHEALENEGERPETLLLLAQINALKGRPEAGRVFLNVLRQNMFQRARVEIGLSWLSSGHNPPARAELTEARTRLVTTDLPSDALPTEPLLRQLLLANPHNQMAFEYLMAHFLLTRQPNKVAEEIRRLNDFDYPAIPRLYEEALLIWEQEKGGLLQNLPRGGVHPETRRRFRRFVESVQRLEQAEPGTIRRALGRDFGDTYWFYHLFRAPQTAEPGLPPPKPDWRRPGT